MDDFSKSILIQQLLAGDEPTPDAVKMYIDSWYPTRAPVGAEPAYQVILAGLIRDNAKYWGSVYSGSFLQYILP